MHLIFMKCLIYSGPRINWKISTWIQIRVLWHFHQNLYQDAPRKKLYLMNNSPKRQKILGNVPTRAFKLFWAQSSGRNTLRYTYKPKFIIAHKLYKKTFIKFIITHKQVLLIRNLNKTKINFFSYVQCTLIYCILAYLLYSI
jgi:hypothetical protein